MSVATIRAAIDTKARELLPEALMAVGITHHKHGWRGCPCSWCAKKREATVVIGSHVPRLYMGHYISEEGVRDAWRDEQRVKYRKQLKDLETA